MLKNKALILETLKDKQGFKVSVRSIASSEDKFSTFFDLTEASEKFIFNSNLIDAVKIKLRYVTLTFNGRHFKKY